LAKTLRDGAAALSEAGDLSEGRAAFGEISQAMLEVERQFGHLAGELREAFCPMAFDNTGASWLQRDTEIANPYFGASMLSCGEIREVFPAHAASGESAAKTGHEDHGPSNNHEGHRKAPANNHEGHRQPPDAGPPGDADTPATVPDSAKRELDQVLIAYFAIQTELASDRTVSATQLAAAQDGVVGAKLEALSAQELETWRGVHVPALVAALEGLKKARSLDEQRTSFEALSSSVQSLVEHFGHLSERSVRRFRCPMAFDNRGADWLQEGPQTLNPYFGSGMLRCGSEVEVFPEAGSAEREGGNR